MLNLNFNFDGFNKLLEWWPIIKSNLQQIQDIINGHAAGTSDKHTAEHITYSGNVPDATNVKEGLDNLKTNVDQIITTPISGEAAAQEMVLARGTYGTLPDRLNGVDAYMADNATEIINLQNNKANNADLAATNVVLSDVQSKANNPLNQITAIPSAKLDTSSDEKKIQLNHLSDAVKAAMAGTTPINASVANGAVVREKIAPGATGWYNTDFINIGKNLFNKDTALTGWVNYANGVYEAVASYYVSDYITVDPSTQYSRKNNHSINYYDASYAWISGALNSGLTFTAPSNCAFIRINIMGSGTSNRDLEQVEEGATSTTYEAFGLKLKAPLNSPTVTFEMLMEHVKRGNFPFQPLATLKPNGDSTGLKIKRAIKSIRLFGDDIKKQYSLVEVRRNYLNKWYISIWEVNGQSLVSKACELNITGYAEPSGLDKVTLSSYNNSGITAEVLIDWIALSSGDAFSSMMWDETGLSPLVHDHYSSRITNLENQNSTPIIKLPTQIYSLVGKEINIYFENIILCDNLNNYKINVISSIGIQQNERWTCAPTTAGTYTLTIEVYNGLTKITSATTNIIVKSTTVGNAVNRKCIFIGDSTTSAGRYTQELLNLFGVSDPMDITLLGTVGTSPNLHEGRGGWKAYDYVTQASISGVTNVFWNPGTTSFDFSYYMAQQVYSDVDYVGIHLGINDIFGYTDDVSLNAEIINILNRFDTMINSIKTYNTNVKIGILVTISPSKNQDAFGKNYNSDQTQWRYKRNNFLFMQALINKYIGQEASNIYLVPINVNLDTEHNMQTETVVANSRNSSTVVRQSNGVHPADSGYYQMADEVYYWLKSFEV